MFFLFWATALSAQNSISRYANFSVFGGYGAQQENIGNNFHFVGAYADYPFFRGPIFNFGIFGVYSTSTFKNNLSLYSAITNEAAGGLNTGVYLEGNGITSFYGGIGVGYKFSQETGRINKTTYWSKSVQSDHLIVANVNLNIYRETIGIPRIQFIGSTQRPISSEKFLSENGRADSTVGTWIKGSLDLTALISAVDLPLNLSGELRLQPKFGFAYHHYNDGIANAISLIGAISVRKLFLDDIGTLFFQYKMYNGGEKNYFTIGANFNLGLMLWNNSN